MIDKATIERIIDAAKIEEVVSDFVALKKKGANYWGNCPFHNEKTPSFSVSPSKGIYKCFGCGKAGNSVKFIMEHESLSYTDALRYLAQKYHIEIKERELTAEELAIQSEKESLLALNAYAKEYFSSILHNHIDGKSIGLSYFRERGFRDDIIQKFELGYSLNQKDAFVKDALAKGYKTEYLYKTGLAIEHENQPPIDRFRGRVMFPWISLSGKVLGFGGRVLDARTKGVDVKYMNSPESEIFSKRNELYGIYQAKQAIVKADCCYLVEGYTDVISMHQSGVENVVSSSGTSLTSGQIRLIKRFTSNIVILYDGDEAGIKASLRGIDLFLAEGMNVKVLLFPDGDDPDSFARKNNANDFVDFIEKNNTDFIQFKTALLMKEAANDPIKRSTLIRDIVQSIAVIPDNITRSVYIRECAKTLETDEQIISSEVAKINQRKNFENRQKAIGELYHKEHLAAAENAGIVIPQQKKAVENATPDSKRAELECNILRCLLRYGMRKMGICDENGEEIYAGEFIINQLAMDDLTFSTPVCQKIYENYCLHFKDTKDDTVIEIKEYSGPALQEGETEDEKYISFKKTNKTAQKIEHYFFNHPDEEISNFAIQLLTNEYEKSRMWEKRDRESNRNDYEDILNEAKRVIFDYKMLLVQIRINHIKQQIDIACKENDSEKADALLKEFSEEQKTKTLLSKELGDRVVTP